MTKIEFKYIISKEFDNFKNTSASINHPEPSAVFKLYQNRYKKLEKDKVILFVKDYLSEKRLNIDKLKNEIEVNWRKVEKEFFVKADKIYKKSLPIQKITAYLTIDNRCSYNFDKNCFFVHLNISQTNKTIMHELWHWYFWHNGGREIKEKYGRLVFNDIKESLTVLLNIEFKDLLKGAVDKGYLQHQALRRKIIKQYYQTKNIYSVIDYCLNDNIFVLGTHILHFD